MFSDVDGVTQTGTSNSPSEKNVDKYIQQHFSEPKSSVTVASTVKTDRLDDVDVDDLFKSITPKMRNIRGGKIDEPLVKGKNYNKCIIERMVRTLEWNNYGFICRRCFKY